MDGSDEFTIATVLSFGKRPLLSGFSKARGSLRINRDAAAGAASDCPETFWKAGRLADGRHTNRAYWPFFRTVEDSRDPFFEVRS